MLENSAFFIPLHPPKAPAPILLTELGILIDVRLEQSPKALSLILVTVFGIKTDDNPVQPIKVPMPIFVIEPGILIDVRLVQLANA
jgi:hypothetical protein